jgi:PTS system ascorbate-specific IIC component
MKFSRQGAGSVRRSNITGFFFSFLVNLLLARFTPMKYVFLTGHHTLFAATLVTGILGLTIFKDGSSIALIAVSSVIVGFMMVFFPWLSAPFMAKITARLIL